MWFRSRSQGPAWPLSDKAPNPLPGGQHQLRRPGPRPLAPLPTAVVHASFDVSRGTLDLPSQQYLSACENHLRRSFDAIQQTGIRTLRAFPLRLFADCRRCKPEILDLWVGAYRGIRSSPADDRWLTLLFVLRKNSTVGAA